MTKMKSNSFFSLSVLGTLLLVSSVTAFTSRPLVSVPRKSSAASPSFKDSTPASQFEAKYSSTQLFYKDDSNDSNNDGKSNVKATIDNSVRRTSMKGVSVSPKGFLILLQTPSIGNIDSNDNENPGNIFMKDDKKAATHKNTILPIRITSTIKDAFATTSAESLTICQLLSGVDMAGAILSPDVLKNIVGLYCSSSLDEEDDEIEEDESIIIEDELGLGMDNENDKDYDNNANVKKFVHDFLSTSLGPNTKSFEEASAYQRSRVIFPKITLDSIKIDIPSVNIIPSNQWTDIVTNKAMMQQQQNTNDDYDMHKKKGLLPIPLQYVLECRIDGDKTLDIPLHSELGSDENDEVPMTTTASMEMELEDSRNIMEQVLYSYDDQCSGAFVPMALALRYKCPIVITSRALDCIETTQNAFEEMDDLDISICIQQVAKNVDAVEEDNDDNDHNDSVFGWNGGDERFGDEENDKVIQKLLPQWRSTTALQDQSQRVVENIEQGFQVTKLQGALRIAQQRGDEKAAKKIRAEISRLLGESG
jgi:hypothetical protein